MIFSLLYLFIYSFIYCGGCIHTTAYVGKADPDPPKKDQTPSRALKVDIDLLDQQTSAM